MYTEFYGLRELPFQVTPDPRFYYANPVYEEAFANLVYAIRHRKGFVCLTGEVGTGKTTLLRRLIENMEPNTPFVFLFNTRLAFDDILTFMCDELGIHSNARSKRLKKIQLLNTFFLDQLRRGGTTALLIDEAQNLKDDTLEDLRLLSNLETNAEKLLQIILVGQPELDEKLSRPSLRQLRQRIGVQIRIDRLSPRETERFIRHRLEVGGYKGPDLFTPDAFVRIAWFSRGVPRLVNQICDNSLVMAFSTSRRTITADIVEEAAHDLGLREVAGEEKPGAGPLDVALGRAGEAALELARPIVGTRRAQPILLRGSKPFFGNPRPRRKRSDRTSAWAGFFLALILIGAGTSALALRDVESMEALRRTGSDWIRALAEGAYTVTDTIETAVEPQDQTMIASAGPAALSPPSAAEGAATGGVPESVAALPTPQSIQPSPAGQPEETTVKPAPTPHAKRPSYRRALRRPVVAARSQRAMKSPTPVQTFDRVRIRRDSRGTLGEAYALPSSRRWTGGGLPHGSSRTAERLGPPGTRASFATRACGVHPCTAVPPDAAGQAPFTDPMP